MNILEFRKQKGMNIFHRKENHFKAEASVIARLDGTFHVPVVIREYRTPSKVSYCIWTHNNCTDANGSGMATTNTDAMLSAMKSAGISVDNYDGDHYAYSQLLMEAVARCIMQYFDYRSDTYYIHCSHA
jgi:hypothetical protein